MEQNPKIKLIHNPRFRSLVIQAMLLTAFVVLAGFAISNTARNLEKAGITSGFGFLKEVAGFDVSLALIGYSRSASYGRAFMVGLLNTLLVSSLAIFFSTILGFLLGIARLSGNWLVSRMAVVYIEIIRNVPLLLQILFWYIAILNPLPRPRQALNLTDMFFLCNRGLILPRPVGEPGFIVTPAALLMAVAASAALIRWAGRRQLRTGLRFPAYYTAAGLIIGLPLLALAVTGFPVHWDIPVLKGFNFRGGMTVLPEFIALCLALSLYAAAFIGENVRSGIMSVDRGQIEAARALGHRPGMTLRLVVIPQAMRVIIPPLTSQHLTLVKNSSLAVVIGYPDLIHVFAGTTLNQTGQAVEIISVTMLVYLTISLIISMIMNRYNKKYAIRGR
ncbi:amino acid ABC transporter permease [Desulfonema ishimotonii]|uniref:Amino acid ABC transporter permease n=1 Tax=Desulfonema ishimotonii TaxID=45657 RepID=A0A401FU33_9BACT|nr:amino acid ABC transporter permease [Desulfonema ishimotonii]GBC60479.1 amino acid ABC transporter permease [Desulfonema ishimotonii]